MFALGSTARIAMRSLTRQRTRSVTLVGALAMFVGLSTVLDAFASGFYGAMTEVAVGQTLGELQAHAPGHLPARDSRLSLDAAVANCVARDASVRVIAKRVRVHAMATGADDDDARPADLLGADAIAERQFGALPSLLREGRLLQPRDEGTRVAVLGTGMARALSTAPGQEITLMAATASGTTGQARFVVVGTFEANTNSAAGSLVYVPTSTLAQWLGLPSDAVTEFALRLVDGANVDDARDRITAACPAAGVVQTWKERAPALAAGMTTDHNFLRATYVLFVCIAGIMVLNLQLMTVLERTRELGMLLALGATPHRIILMLTMEASVLGLVGIAAGLGLGLAGVAAMSGGVDVSALATSGTVAGVPMVPVVYPLVDPRLLGGVCGGILLATVLAAVGPTLRLRTLNPVAAMRGERTDQRAGRPSADPTTGSDAATQGDQTE